MLKQEEDTDHWPYSLSDEQIKDFFNTIIDRKILPEDVYYHDLKRKNERRINFLIVFLTCGICFMIGILLSFLL